ncbi:GGDEF domain-containing protein [Nitratireductor indicus]|uniref:GGDEF domain-containing protein n=1 Tax=Nitratireductor indicus TaxID=721133 RepID=UPI0028766787|nr:diguanylate cyclase [Nitratireductor indicus]MDS1138631.1 diguanylate cyclase [Nitratireductor indicus]
MTTAALFAGFLQNLGIAALVAIVYDMALRNASDRRIRRFVTAFVLAAGAVGSMMMPFELAPGLIFDLRHSFLILAMSYGGWPAAILSAACAIAFRIWVGGAGMWAGVLGIAISASAGVAFALYFRQARLRMLTFALLGLGASLPMASLFVLPWETALMILETVSVPMTLANIAGTVLVGEILERRRIQYYRENVLSQEASTDALTQLANRRVFDMRGPDLLMNSARKGEPCTVMVVDIDHFKQINDTYGHDTGDKVLRHLSQIVRSNVRKSDLVARYGGEEIALVLPGHDSRGGGGLAERLRRAVENAPFPLDNRNTIPLSVSIGLYANEGWPESFWAAFKRADTALYRAKSLGRNRVEVALA